MAGENQFYPVATGAGANVRGNAAWGASGLRQTGFQSGIAPSLDFNAAFRQGTVMASALGQVVADTGNSALDDGNQAGLVANIKAALASYVEGGVPSKQRVHFGADTGIANRIIADVSPDIASYESGVLYLILAANAPTGPAVANLDGRGDRNIVRRDGTAIQANDWVAGEVIELRDDGTRLQLAGLTSNAAFQTFITQFYATPLTYWRMDSPSTVIPAGIGTTIGNYANVTQTVGSGTNVNTTTGKVTIGQNDGGTYVLTATNAMDIPTTEETIVITVERLGAIAVSRGPYPAPGNNANDQSTTAVIRLQSGDVIRVDYIQNNPNNSPSNTLNQPLGHFGGVRVGG